MNKQQQMMKEASEFIKEATDKLQKMAETEQHLKNSRRQVECFKIATEMLRKEIISPEDLDSTVNNLVASNESIEMLKKAVEMNNGHIGLTLTLPGEANPDDKRALNSEAVKAAAVEKFLENFG